MYPVKTGTVTGTGAAINVELGFVPDYVKVVNYTDGDRIDEWFAGMPDGSAITTILAVASTASNGISVYSGAAGTNSKGFTIGSTISESAKVLYYFAARSGL